MKVEPSVKGPGDGRGVRPGCKRVESSGQDQELLHVYNGDVEGCPGLIAGDLEDDDFDDDHDLEGSRHQCPHRGC